MNYSFDELVRKQCVYCLRFNPVDETCKVSGKLARNTCECNCFQPVRDSDDNAVESPAHYTSGNIECIYCIKAALGENFIGFLIGNVIKYTYRYKDKNGVEDLRKAQWYLERAIKELSENE